MKGNEREGKGEKEMGKEGDRVTGDVCNTRIGERKRRTGRRSNVKVNVQKL